MLTPSMTRAPTLDWHVDGASEAATAVVSDGPVVIIKRLRAYPVHVQGERMFFLDIDCRRRGVGSTMTEVKDIAQRLFDQATL